MDIFLFQIILLFSITVFFIQKKYKYLYSLAIQIAVIIISSYWALLAFSEAEEIKLYLFALLNNDVYLVIDRLSAFFILVINFTMLTGMLYAKGYLRSYYEQKNAAEISLHYFSFIWLHLSMILVCAFNDGLSFLIAWEMMSLSSFFLVIFESEKEDTIKTGIKYLMQMHIGLVFLITAFLIAYIKTGGDISFDNLSLYFEQNKPFTLFLLFFVGFGIKAGFIPFHTWLPHAHPTAPSHVSGVMSGVMIKMGIYGILRVLTYIHTDLYQIGLFVLFISIISGVLGVILAIIQHDIKKLLAYHSIENIGIIGIGIGIGIMGLATNNLIIAALGFSGGILHTLNHSLFKSLLFYSAGNVYKQTHTRNIEHLGGLIKKMPKTAFFFLLGAIAISGLPPFNGFISEFLIYLGMFKGLHAGDLSLALVLLSGIIGLALIGGLAVFCFTKVFSIIFLGNNRSNKTDNAHEVENSMFFPKVIISVFIVGIGVLPALIISPIKSIVNIFVHNSNTLEQVIPSLSGISLVMALFLILVIALLLIRKWTLRKNKIETGPTWGCGYTASDSRVHQYTATSYADYIGNLANPITNIKKQYKMIDKDDIFPSERTFKTHSTDIIEDNLILKPSDKLIWFMRKIAILQNGNLQSYLLYALFYLALILVLTISNFI